MRRPVLQTNNTFLGRAMGLWVIAEGVRTNIHHNCYPQVTRAVALVVLNAGTAGLKHLPDFSIGTAGLVKLKLLYWERVKKEKTTSHT